MGTVGFALRRSRRHADPNPAESLPGEVAMTAQGLDSQRDRLALQELKVAHEEELHG